MAQFLSVTVILPILLPSYKLDGRQREKKQIFVFTRRTFWFHFNLPPAAGLHQISNTSKISASRYDAWMNRFSLFFRGNLPPFDFAGEDELSHDIHYRTMRRKRMLEKRRKICKRG